MDLRLYTSLKYSQMFLLALWISLLNMYRTQAFPTVTDIYGHVGKPVHLPCIAFELLGKAANPEIEARWAKQEEGIYQMVVVKDKNGVKETFGRLNLGESFNQPNASLKNDKFYGRVNVSASYGLVINDVQKEDAGKFSCKYKNMQTNERDESEVNLIVFNETGTGTKNNTSGSGGNGNDPADKATKDTSCTIWQALFGVTVSLLIFYVLGRVVHKKYPTVLQPCWPTRQGGDGDIRIPDIPSEGLDNFVPNKYTAGNGNDSSIAQVDEGSPRILSTRFSEERYVPDVYFNGNASGNRCGKGNDNCIVRDNGGVAMGKYILTEHVKKSNCHTSEL